jgi:7-dehydrocholesterol reductase
VLAFITHSKRLAAPTLSAFWAWCQKVGAQEAARVVLLDHGIGSLKAWAFFGAFCLLALVLNFVPAKTESGPLTATGHLPQYVDNGMRHCVLFSAVFFGCSNLGLGLFDLRLLYDIFPDLIQVLNIFGLVFCVFLTYKGLKRPSTEDAGSSGSYWLDYYWGTELYPRIFGVDVKRFVNCRFSMTFWQLAPIVYAYTSYVKHGTYDYGLCFAALSQYIYLAKFFYWEIGYMRSIDIIVDRAGFYETWGCLCFVPAVYTLHSRICVASPSQLSFNAAAAIFAVGLSGVLLNFWADMQRQRFRERKGKGLVWGKKPKYIEASYTVLEKGKRQTKTSLLLASGFWGIARHSHYLFELMAAWSWCLLANPFKNGVLVLSYAVFLTILLLHRAKRDEEKCLKKYGDDYRKYVALVPYKVIPGVY